MQQLCDGSCLRSQAVIEGPDMQTEADWCTGILTSHTQTHTKGTTMASPEDGYPGDHTAQTIRRPRFHRRAKLWAHVLGRVASGARRPLPKHDGDMLLKHNLYRLAQPDSHPCRGSRNNSPTHDGRAANGRVTVSASHRACARCGTWPTTAGIRKPTAADTASAANRRQRTPTRPPSPEGLARA